MISRRLLRIKVLQIYYSHLFSNPRFDVESARKELNKSIESYHKLYLLLMDLLVEIQKFTEQKYDIEMNKYFKDEALIISLKKIVDNQVIAKLRTSRTLESLKKSYLISWNSNHQAFLKAMFKDFQETDLFLHLTDEESNFDSIRKFTIKILTNFFHYYGPLYIELEEMSIYWNDDIEFTLNMVEKTIKNIDENTKPDAIKIFEMFKNDDDRLFAFKLLETTILDYEEREKQMKPFLKNWDLQRIFVLDLYIVQLAITEFLSFPTIPVKVTINEYIDISKVYCTPKSWAFINGILDKIASNFKANGLINKSGRGLVDK